MLRCCVDIIGQMGSTTKCACISRGWDCVVIGGQGSIKRNLVDVFVCHVCVIILGQNWDKTKSRCCHCWTEYKWKTSGCIYAEALYWDDWFAEKLKYLLYLCDGIVFTLLVRWCVKTNSCFISVAWLCCHCRSRKKQSKEWLCSYWGIVLSLWFKWKKQHKYWLH